MTKQSSNPKRSLQKFKSKPLRGRKMLLQLSNKQVEQAFQFLANPLEKYPPEELSHLSPQVWNALHWLLNQLYEEKKYHPVQ